MKTRLLPFTLVFLAACATTYSPIPEGYTGPVVLLGDTGRQESTSKGTFFSAVEIDGRSIENSLEATRKLSAGQGPKLRSHYTQRNVPVTPMKVKIIGTHQTGAPIHEIASRMAGTFYSVDGVVDFNPVAEHRYMVTGELKKERSCVWIADVDSSEPVTEKICASEANTH